MSLGAPSPSSTSLPAPVSNTSLDSLRAPGHGLARRGPGSGPTAQPAPGPGQALGRAGGAGPGAGPPKKRPHMPAMRVLFPRSSSSSCTPSASLEYSYARQHCAYPPAPGIHAAACSAGAKVRERAWVTGLSLSRSGAFGSMRVFPHGALRSDFRLPSWTCLNRLCF